MSNDDESLSTFFGQAFLDMSSFLDRVETDMPGITATVLGHLGFSHGSATRLIRTTRIPRALGVRDEELYRIGWPKLRLIAPAMTQEDRDALLELARRETLAALSERMAGRRPKTLAVRLSFTAAQHAVFETALREFGARPSPDGLLNREPALITALITAMRPAGRA